MTLLDLFSFIIIEGKILFCQLEVNDWIQCVVTLIITSVFIITVAFYQTETNTQIEPEDIVAEHFKFMVNLEVSAKSAQTLGNSEKNDNQDASVLPCVLSLSEISSHDFSNLC